MRIDLSEIEYNDGQITELSEIFFDAIFKVPALEQFHTIVTGIKNKKQVIFMGEMGISGRKQIGCDWVSNPGIIPTDQKRWSPEYIGDRFDECFTDLLDTFFAWDMKSGVEKPDLTNTKWSTFLEERVGRSAQEAVLRHAWLGNTAAENVSDGGVIKDGVDVEYFNAIDGFWVQVVQIVTANAVQRVTITQNAGATYVLQQFSAADITNKVVTGYLQSLLFSADMRLRDLTDKVFVVTQSIFDQYILERSTITNSEIAYQRVEDGIDYIEYMGVPLIPFSFLDRMIRTYEDNGTKFNNPHRALLTTKSTLQIGVEEVSDLSDLDPFYDKKTKRYFVDYAFNLDAMIARDYNVMAAY